MTGFQVKTIGRDTDDHRWTDRSRGIVHHNLRQKV